MATMLPSTHGIFIPEVWSKDVLEARRSKLVMSNLVNKQYEKELSYGDTLHIVSIGELTADQMIPGTALVPVVPTETEQTLVIDQYYGKAIEIQDVLKKQSMYDLRQPYTERIGHALARAIDASLVAQWENVATANKMTAAATLTFNKLVDAHTLLDAKDVPMEDRALVINAVILGDLRKLPEFTSYEATGRQGVREKQMGIVGEMYGTPVYLTNTVSRHNAAGVDQNAYQALLFHKDAFTVAIQLNPEMESDRDILKKTDLVSGSTLWGRKTVRPDHAVVIPRTA